LNSVHLLMMGWLIIWFMKPVDSFEFFEWLNWFVSLDCVYWPMSSSNWILLLSLNFLYFLDKTILDEVKPWLDEKRSTAKSLKSRKFILIHLWKFFVVVSIFNQVCAMFSRPFFSLCSFKLWRIWFLKHFFNWWEWFSV
jgi:hypothetical protein